VCFHEWGGAGGRVCFNILSGSVSFGCSAASSASQAFFMKVSTFGLFAAMLFP
jgi:hypothetical protein